MHIFHRKGTNIRSTTLSLNAFCVNTRFNRLLNCFSFQVIPDLFFIIKALLTYRDIERTHVTPSHSSETLEHSFKKNILLLAGMTLDQILLVQVSPGQTFFGNLGF